MAKNGRGGPPRDRKHPFFHPEPPGRGKPSKHARPPRTGPGDSSTPDPRKRLDELRKIAERKRSTS